MYDFFVIMYPTPVRPEKILKYCKVCNVKIEDIWFELDKGPLSKIIHYRGRCKYLINKRRINKIE
jgi:hypothetical protein